jgi:hypothetical protein
MGLSWPAKNRDQPGLCINCSRKNTPLTSVDSLSRDQGQDTQKNCGEPALPGWRRCSRRVKVGKDRCEHMFSAVLQKADILPDMGLGAIEPPE